MEQLALHLQGVRPPERPDQVDELGRRPLSSRERRWLERLYRARLAAADRHFVTMLRDLAAFPAFRASAAQVERLRALPMKYRRQIGPRAH